MAIGGVKSVGVLRELAVSLSTNRVECQGSGLEQVKRGVPLCMYRVDFLPLTNDHQLVDGI